MYQKKLIISFFLIVIMFVLIAIYNINGLFAIGHYTHSISDHPLVVSNASLRAAINITKIHRNMKDVVLSTSEDELMKILALIDNEECNVYRDLETVKSKIIGSEGQQLEKESRILFDEWKSIRDQVVILWSKGEKERAIEITKKDGAKHVDQLEDKVLELYTYARAKAESFRLELDHSQTKMERMNILLTVVGVIISLIIAILSAHSFIKYEGELKNREHMLVESNRSKESLFSIISHDLRGPIGNISSVLSLLSSGVIDEKLAQGYFDHLSLSVKSTESLLENLLNWSANQKDSIEIDKDIFNVDNAIQNEINILQPIADRKYITINLLSKNKIDAIADMNMIQLVVRNLISNSIKFTPKDGRVSVESDIVSNHLQIKVSDTGLGMSDEMKTKIFDETVFVSTKGTEREHGSGLGLKLCYSFVKAHGGDITVKSRENIGTTFTVTIPQ